ncbi:CobW family GTP-binding protein [Parasedimentitalea maritima]|uniref:GTP-binding protein n=1 Tax=Parasedimentitalea maritima TaxID=2578117 RepID=A0A6A4RKY1_9RHOB|nr:GTP-binding protein [Zongyanglinia marina]KAE9631004.1 GTP-binding protein [Zongyanglinia marina]
MTRQAPIPIILLTGFLGAGKTTWLSRALRHESAGRTAVLVNEFGEVGIDHLLVGTIAPDTVLLNSGCICCQIRGELKDAILDVITRAERGEIPTFEKIVIETTGLADPSQILSTLMFDPVLHNQVSLQHVVTVADAQNGATIHSAQPEWVGQIAAASVLLLTKADLVSSSKLQALRMRLALVNPTAEQLVAQDCPGFRDIDGPGDSHLPTVNFDKSSQHQDGTGARTLSLTLERPMDWVKFIVWLSALIHRHGAKLLRVKCLLNTEETGPVLIDGVGHTLHHPRHLDSEFASDEKSRLVFIARDLDMMRLRLSFEKFVGT